MKKILVILLMLVTFNAHSVSEDSLRTKVVCVEGYKFLVVYSTDSMSSPSVTQIFKSDKPLRCHKK